MDVTRNVETGSLAARVAIAATQIELPARIALACVALSWFFLDTLVGTLGSLQHGIRFFESSAVIADPSRIFFGSGGWAHRAGFGLLCWACLFAPVLPHLRPGKAMWLAYLAPISLMAVCGTLLIWRTSGQFIAAPHDAGHIAGTVSRFANDLVHHASTLMTRHVSIGVGGYLGFLASFVLALRGVRHFRRENLPQQAA